MKTETKQQFFNYLIELLIAIIGISVAFWLNNISTNNKMKAERKTYLVNIKNDLRTDSVRLGNSIKNNEAKIAQLYKGLQLIESAAPIDSVLEKVMIIGNYDFFFSDNFTLTSLLQSEDLKLIDAEETKRELLRQLRIYDLIDNMQKNFLQALDDVYFPMLLTKIDMTTFEAVDPAYFYCVEIKKLLRLYFK